MSDILSPEIDVPTHRGFTARAVVTGMVLGGGLSLCNIYLGLKIGWGMNMAITAALLGFALWSGLVRALRLRPFGMLENNMSQMSASAAAAISSAGLVAPIPALTMLNGTVLTWPQLSAWVLSVGLVGVVAAIGVHKQLLGDPTLRFPSGIATAHTLKEMYAHGAEAVARVKMLLWGGVAGATSKLLNVLLHPSNLMVPVTFGAGGRIPNGYSLANLTVSLEPSLLMIATGGIIGLRSALSMLLGAVVAWGILAPITLERGWMMVGPADPLKPWFSTSVQWLLWPGVTLMVVGSLTSFAYSGPAILASLLRPRATSSTGGADPRDVSRRAYYVALVLVILGSCGMQIALFDIKPWLSVVAVALSFGLAIVAGRVSGETAVTPVSAMGKVTQLTFGVIDPSNVASNLMSANVTGGAASQCADLLHDLKAGALLGSWPKHQAVAQAAGVLAGALVGSAAYLVLLPDPANQLMTDQWPAPSVATWKAVAELFQKGLSAMPPYAMEAMTIAAAVAIGLVLTEKRGPKAWRAWTPSPVSIGLAFTIQAYTVLAFLLGATIMALGERYAPKWTGRFGIVLCAGVIAGESIIGVGDAFWKMFGG